jgi:hypothetical protein
MNEILYRGPSLIQYLDHLCVLATFVNGDTEFFKFLMYVSKLLG